MGVEKMDEWIHELYYGSIEEDVRWAVENVTFCAIRRRMYSLILTRVIMILTITWIFKLNMPQTFLT